MNGKLPAPPTLLTLHRMDIELVLPIPELLIEPTDLLQDLQHQTEIRLLTIDGTDDTLSVTLEHTNSTELLDYYRRFAAFFELLGVQVRGRSLQESTNEVAE